LGYIITKAGKKIEVDNEEEVIAENVVLISYDAILKDNYVINIFKKNMWEKGSGSEFVTEIIIEHKPNNEEIMYHMVQNGVNRASGYASIDKIKVLDFKD